MLSKLASAIMAHGRPVFSQRLSRKNRCQRGKPSHYTRETVPRCTEITPNCMWVNTDPVLFGCALQFHSRVRPLVAKERPGYRGEGNY